MSISGPYARIERGKFHWWVYINVNYGCLGAYIAFTHRGAERRAIRLLKKELQRQKRRNEAYEFRLTIIEEVQP